METESNFKYVSLNYFKPNMIKGFIEQIIAQY